MVTARRQRNGRRGGTAHGLTRGEVVVIVSGKGGVGKSNLAVNLGIQLSRSALRVVLVDADLGLANADILLNVSPLGDVSDLLDYRIPPDDVLMRGPDGLRVVCGATGMTRRGEACDLDPLNCVRAIERLDEFYDVLLIDCPAGVAPLVSDFALAGDRLVVVTTPEPTALADAYATLKTLYSRGFGGCAGLIVNMAESRAEADSAARRLQQAADRFLGLSLENLGYVVFDRHVPAAVRERTPVIVRYPRCAASSCMAEVCRRLSPPPPVRGRPGGLWARVASLFL